MTTTHQARRRHDRGELLRAAVEVCSEGGLDALSFQAVSRRSGVPDRTVVYYFPTKPDLVEAVLEVMAGELMARLQTAVGDGRRSARQLGSAVWAVLTDDAVRPAGRVWLEMAVRASEEKGPYRLAAQKLAEAWLGWLEDRIQAPTPARRKRAAAALLAQLDGALLLQQMGLVDAATEAMRS